MDSLWPAPAESTVPDSASIPDGVFSTAAGQHRRVFRHTLTLTLLDLVCSQARSGAECRPASVFEWAERHSATATWLTTNISSNLALSSYRISQASNRDKLAALSKVSVKTVPATKSGALSYSFAKIVVITAVGMLI